MKRLPLLSKGLLNLKNLFLTGKTMKQKKIKNMTINELNTYTFECLNSLETQNKILKYWKETFHSWNYHLGRKPKLEEIKKQEQLAITTIDNLQEVLVELQKYQEAYVQTCKNQINTLKTEQ